MAENIADYGGVEGMNTESARTNNVQAINDASEAALDNTVYLPAGDWYIGHDDIAAGFYLRPGDSGSDRGANGLGFTGDGPEQSFLIYGMVQSDGGNTIRYEDDEGTHDGILWEDMTLDGNEGNLTLDGDDGQQWGVRFNAGGDVTWRNVRIQNCWSSAVQGGLNMDVNRCTFRNNAVGKVEASDGSRTGHHFGTSIDSDQTIEITNSEFLNCSGSAADTNGEGEYIIDNCYVEGAGGQMFKIADPATITLSRIRHIGWTQYLEDRQAGNSTVHLGRYFLKRRSGTGADQNTNIGDVYSTRLTGRCFWISDLDVTVNQDSGEPVQFENVGKQFGDVEPDAARGFGVGDVTSGGEFILDLEELGVHDANYECIEFNNSSGSISELRRNDTDGFDDSGSVTISTDNQGASTYSPDVPSQDEVGINSQGNSLAVSTGDATSVDESTATLNGTLDSLGGASTVDTYFEWRETDADTWNSTSVQSLSSTESFEDTISDLNHSTEYEFRSVGDASDGDTNRGSLVTFSTEDGESDSPLFEDWTPRRASSESDWDLFQLNGNPVGDATLELEPDSGNSHALSFDDVSEPTDAEIVALCRVPSDDDGLHSFGRLYLRGDDSALHWGWTSIIVEDGTYMFRMRFNDGDSVTDPEEIAVDNTSVSSAIDNWFYRRFEVSGDTWRMRAWDYDDEEPDSWDIEVTDSTITESGYVGTGGYSTDKQQFDYVSVGTGGESAQLPQSDGPPVVTWESPTDGETVSGSHTIQLDASDSEDEDDSLTVEYRIDDSSWTTATYNAEAGYYEETWDSTTVADGERTLEARATDSSDNISSATADVTIDNEADITVETVDAQDVTDSTATLVGELTSLDGVDETDVGFEWRESGQDTWNLVGEQTVDSVGEFRTEISGLENDTDHEFRGIVHAPEEVDGSVLSFRTAIDENVVPTIEQFDITERSNPVWTRFDVDWTVSDENGNLDRVVTELLYGGVTVDAEATNISGERASYTHSMRVQGDVDEIKLSVNDSKNAVNTESKDV